MFKKKWVAGIILSGFVATIGLAMENKGAANMQIDGGSRGSILFPHRIHQDKIGDCKTCHAIFPQESHSLAKLKKNGQMKPKAVMIKLCVNCHKAEKKAGNKAGPTTCSKCHIR
jgi:DNA-directed RNA polymerase subunit M/transcription elongation factor TFIIS